MVTKPVLKLMEIIAECEDKLIEWDFDLLFSPNFHEWNKETGLGRAYRNTQLKLRIAERLLTAKHKEIRA